MKKELRNWTFHKIRREFFGAANTMGMREASMGLNKEVRMDPRKSFQRINILGIISQEQLLLGQEFDKVMGDCWLKREMVEGQGDFKEKKRKKNIRPWKGTLCFPVGNSSLARRVKGSGFFLKYAMSKTCSGLIRLNRCRLS
jgi:hypothetical protein